MAIHRLGTPLAHVRPAGQIITDLYGLHNRLSGFARRLRNGVWWTYQLRGAYDEMVKLRQRFVDFGQAHGAWFQVAFPDEAAALSDAIPVLAAVRDEMQTVGLLYRTGGKDTLEHVTQAHRDQIAAVIEANLEA